MRLSRLRRDLVTSALLCGGVASAAVVADPSGALAASRPAAGPRVVAATAAQGYTAVGPTRIFDSRGTTDGALTAGTTTSLQVTGVAGVPASGVGAVVLNVTAVGPSASTYLTVYPAGTSRPLASNLNVAAHETRANLVIAKVGAGGRVVVFNRSGATQLVIDVQGWFATGSSYTAQAPARILDTRAGTGAPKQPVAGQRTVTVQVAGHGGVPKTGVTAVALNLLGVGPTHATYVTAYPAGSARPTTSNLNLAQGRSSAVLVMAPLSSTGGLTLYNASGSTELVADVAGWFTGTGDYTPVSPSRLLDTRYGPSISLNENLPVQVAGVGGVPVDAGAVALSVTVVQPQAGGYFSVQPDGVFPTTSNVNLAAHTTVPNLVIAQLSSNGKLTVYNHALGGNVIIDVEGWLPTYRALAIPWSNQLPPAAIGHAFDYSFPGPGGVPPYTWTLQGGALPPGVSLSATDGRISGTPTATGYFSAAVSVTDATGATASAPASIDVLAPASGQVWGWGKATYGKLGPDNPSGVALAPKQVPDVTGFTTLAAGTETTYGRKADGTVWLGPGFSGELGDGTQTTSTTTPVRVGGLTGITELAAASTTGYALKADGTVWAWGLGTSGQLGNGSSTSSPTPVQVGGLTGITAIGAGTTAAYAVRSDGTVAGSNNYGQLGLGTSSAGSSTPQQVPGLSAATAVAGATAGAYALQSDGTVWAWGSGYLGNGQSDSHVGPVQVSGLTGVSSIGAGSTAGYAAKSDGTAWAWGANANGQVGDGTTDTATTPIRIGNLTQVVRLTGGIASGYALQSDGRVWSWGDSFDGILGDGLEELRSHVPPVRALSAPLTSIAVNPIGFTVSGTSPT